MIINSDLYRGRSCTTQLLLVLYPCTNTLNDGKAIDTSPDTCNAFSDPEWQSGGSSDRYSSKASFIKSNLFMLTKQSHLDLLHHRIMFAKIPKAFANCLNVPMMSLETLCEMLISRFPCSTLHPSSAPSLWHTEQRQYYPMI